MIHNFVLVKNGGKGKREGEVEMVLSINNVSLTMSDTVSILSIIKLFTAWAGGGAGGATPGYWYLPIQRHDVM